MRKTILNIVGAILILAAGLLISRKMTSSKKAPSKKGNKSTMSVLVKDVQNQTLPVRITSTGPLIAKDRIIISSEVQGVFTSSSKSFKEGERYVKGQALIRINNAEFAASVSSQRIAFKSLVTSLLADIKFDYPEELGTWESYAASIKPNAVLPKLPSVQSENLGNYLTIKNINSNYYNIKNLETRLFKYTIAAPFSGTLVKASVTPGTLITPGQNLGEFIRPGVYELELNVNASLLSFLEKGKKVKLQSIDGGKKFEGKVSRINQQIDQASQTVQIFVQINNSGLKEGEYLEAIIEAQSVKNVIEVDRNVVFDKNHVFLVENQKLKKVPIDVIYASENSMMIKGLENGSQLVTIPVPGGYDGMSINIRK
jgi:multidrug efflux pump subunit AcrA (membrane-fusion protein)